jgi:hypothetical protein
VPPSAALGLARRSLGEGACIVYELVKVHGDPSTALAEEKVDLAFAILMCPLLRSRQLLACERIAWKNCAGN